MIGLSRVRFYFRFSLSLFRERILYVRNGDVKKLRSKVLSNSWNGVDKNRFLVHFVAKKRPIFARTSKLIFDVGILDFQPATEHSSATERKKYKYILCIINLYNNENDTYQRLFMDRAWNESWEEFVVMIDFDKIWSLNLRQICL